MKELLLFACIVTLSGGLLSGCTVPNQSSSLQEQISLMASRKSAGSYKEVRAKFIENAQANDIEGLYEMMKAYGYERSQASEFLRTQIIPFFSDYSEIVEPEVLNIVNDEAGDPGYTLYGFILTASGEKKPYAMAIIEKGEGFAIKNIVVNQCFKGLHLNC